MCMMKMLITQRTRQQYSPFLWSEILKLAASAGLSGYSAHAIYKHAEYRLFHYPQKKLVFILKLAERDIKTYIDLEDLPCPTQT